MAKIIYEVYQNKNEHTAAYGKFYARVKYLENLNTRKLSNHIAEHGSVYTPDVVYGVMEKFRSCLIEMLLQSKKVKIDGLGTFYATIECRKGGAVSKDKFSVQRDVEGLHIRFLPEQEQETNISSRQFLKQAEFINVDSLVKSDENENGGSNGGSSQNSGSGNGGSNTGGGTGSVTPSNGGNSGSGTSSAPKLTISRSGNGTSSVSANGNTVNSGSELQAGTEVSIRITPAEGKIPSATLNGSNVALTENNGVYTGSFQMPSGNATLAINSGGTSGSDGGDMN